MSEEDKIEKFVKDLVEKDSELSLSDIKDDLVKELKKYASVRFEEINKSEEEKEGSSSKYENAQEIVIFEKPEDKMHEVIELIKHDKQLEAYQLLVEDKPQNNIGAIPSPDVLRQYNEIDPEIVKVLVGEMKSGQEYMRTRIEKQDDAIIDGNKTIRVFQLVLAVCGLVISGILAFSDKGWTAIIILALALGLVYAINPNEDRKFSMEKIIENLKK